MRTKFILMLGLLFDISVASEDPCLKGNHQLLTNLGSRNERCYPSEIPLEQRLCDQYLPTGWYSTENALMLNRAPISGTCGVDSPAWLKDQFPNASDGIVNRTVCIQDEQEHCFEELSIQIKNCSTFYVYFMKPLPDTVSCPAAYCFNSILTCRGEPVSSSTSQNPMHSTSFNYRTITASSGSQFTSTVTSETMISTSYNDLGTPTISSYLSTFMTSMNKDTMLTSPNERLVSSTPVQHFVNEAGQSNNEIAVYALGISLAVCFCILAVLVTIICCALKRRKSGNADSYLSDYSQPMSHSTTANIYDSINQVQNKT